ncbi:histidinol dehydrogenase [Bizionia sediminis]|uniref:Histidinol dehydrogenase n=1 Tax=Bizionia sediminis TaxID=1737064 RepID=A0ABW5KRF0_9FLAO
MKIIKYPSANNWLPLVARATKSVTDIEETVNQIFKDIEKHGDKAVLKYTNIFDGVTLNSLQVIDSELEKAKKGIKPELQAAIQTAYYNITKFHAAQKTTRIAIETMPGVSCWQENRPIQKVGLYIPGGTAPLFSTVLMLAIPAQLAGCTDIVLCSPPNKNGQIANEILYAAALCGVRTIYKVGGIQAIAALTFGTETIKPVYKIFGPGNQFVTVAKQMATKYGVAIDMPAGPSELLIVADNSAVPAFVAADLLSQAEHGADSQVIFVTTSQVLLQEVLDEISKQMEALPRKSLVENAIKNSKAILVSNNQEALNFINDYAPEHLIICTNNDAFFTEGVCNAGSVFIGNYTPESAGDYASGTNHTLPTNGFSKAYSGVNLNSFMKAITFQKLSKQGIYNLGPAIQIMAEAEGLQAHKNAVTIRLNSLKS